MRIILFLLLCSSVHAQHVQYVNPLMGTAPATTISAKKHGAGTEMLANVIPAVGLPFGMVQLTPQTRTTEKKCQAPYYYNDKTSSGYRFTHWLSGSCTQDYGSVTIMPVTSGGNTLDHGSEVSQPHYYKNKLGNVQTEMTATLRCGMLQFTMLQDDSLYIMVTPNSDKQKGGLTIDTARKEITGYNPVYRIYQGSGQPAGFSGWFVIQYDASQAVATATGIKLYAKKGTVIKLRVGTSFTDLGGARLNMKVEMDTWDFSALRKRAEGVWEKALGQIEVSGSDEKAKRIFYTSLYHSMQHPRLMSNVYGTYPRFAGDYQNEQLRNGQGDYYDDFSMWDIYRAQLPLFEILQPRLINDFVRSMILKGTQGGWLPIFPCWNSYTAAMIGDHGTAFIASAYNKNIRNYDVEAAYALMRRNAFDVAPAKDYKDGKGRRALTSYLQYGYIPLEDSVMDAFHKREQVSRTLEYAYDDYALFTVARSLGKTEDAVVLEKRAGNYKNVFDKNVGLMNGRYADGSFYKSFHADKKLPFITEGTPRQYTFYVPQDMKGLSSLLNLEASLDSLFDKNEYWHGNEPGHHIPFLYNFTAAPWKTQEKVARILKEEYSDGIGGLSGNDDAGQMSAWYVFAAMGLYPVDPVGGEYMLCTPIFDQISIHLPNGKKMNIKTSGMGAYIQSITVNGKPYKGFSIPHETLVQGGDIFIKKGGSPASKL
ncbi:glycoside hydrolase family 92 protein [Chitinophaga sp. SYP-B3965]|nr:glycoside hydrolase family 92 protein [Chitinophaga sp. SYP-B3965]